MIEQGKSIKTKLEEAKERKKSYEDLITKIENMAMDKDEQHLMLLAFRRSWAIEDQNIKWYEDRLEALEGISNE